MTLAINKKRKRNITVTVSTVRIKRIRGEIGFGILDSEQIENLGATAIRRSMINVVRTGSHE